MFWYEDHSVLWQAALVAAVLAGFWGLLISRVYAVLVRVTRWPGRGRGGHRVPRILELRPVRVEVRPEMSGRLRQLADVDALTDPGGPR